MLLRRSSDIVPFPVFPPDVKREEDLKVREKTLQNLRIKGAFTAQELYDGHRGEK